jgi:general secretion pathway protein A
MYLRYYGLRELPFELTANPRFLLLTPGHREALRTLEYGLSAAKAVTVLIGEAGTGKTTLLRAALQSEACRQVRCVYLHNPALTRAEFLQTLSRELNLGAQASDSKAKLLENLETVLRERRAAGEIVALVVDEAQSLSYELLEEIRLLGNIETPIEKLLPLVLAGQPEFADRLNERELRQLKQRVGLRCYLKPLAVQETASYIASRIRAASGEAARLFTREAVMLIHEHSHGTPRTINVICDNALVTAMALGRQRVDRQVVLEVCADFDLRRAAPPGGNVVADADPLAVDLAGNPAAGSQPAGDDVGGAPGDDGGGKESGAVYRIDRHRAEAKVSVKL